MAKSLLSKIKKYQKIIIIATIVLFLLLIMLGAVLGPGKTWE